MSLRNVKVVSESTPNIAILNVLLSSSNNQLSLCVEQRASRLEREREREGGREGEREREGGRGRKRVDKMSDVHVLVLF